MASNRDDENVLGFDRVESESAYLASWQERRGMPEVPGLTEGTVRRAVIERDATREPLQQDRPSTSDTNASGADDPDL